MSVKIKRKSELSPELREVVRGYLSSGLSPWRIARRLRGFAMVRPAGRQELLSLAKDLESRG